jgi:hypothetical protein
MNTNNNNKIKSFGLLPLYSAITGRKYDTWFRKDMLLFIERYIIEEGKMVDKYRILPNTNDGTKIGHIDFTKHVYATLEEAAMNMNKL